MPQVKCPSGCDLSWVDSFVRNIQPYVFVREEDNLLIKRPNQAQKLNRQGVLILKALLDGQRLGTVLDAVGRTPERFRAIAAFLFAVRGFMEGTLTEETANSAVKVEPFDRHFSTLPVLSEVAVTYRCNLRCSFCYAGCNCTANPVGEDREMTTAEIAGVLDAIFRDAKVPSVSFTGGEPTLRRDLPDLVRHAKDLGMRVNLITNGTQMTAALAERLAGAGLDSAQVSLEGPTAAVHERITAVAGSFARTVAAVRYLAEAGVTTHTNTTLNGENIDEAALMPRFVKETLGRDKFSMNLVIPTGSAALNRRLVVRYSELEPHLLAVAEASEDCGVEFMWYSPTPLCMFNPIAHGMGNKGCSACDGLLSIAPNGDVLPCSSFPDSVGNILSEDVVSVWQSEKARGYRDKCLAHAACRACEDFALCHGACPLYWQEMGFDELRACRGIVAKGDKS